MKKGRLYLLTGLLLLTQFLYAQTRTVSGLVTDNEGRPMPQVTVIVPGSTRGTTTNAEGHFTLQVPQGTRSLQFSFVGFQTINQDIPESGNMSVTLRPGADNSMNEVVITGYTRQRRAEYSGAGSKVTAQQIAQVPMGSFDQILQGRAPGLLVTAGSGQPGAAARVQIRGASSINGGSNPLYIVDGVPVEAGVFQALNPNDFESVDVLRDASATALYGNRGGSGVIVVTTKKGRAGKTQVSYAGQVGFTEPGKQNFEMMNSSELLQFQETLGRMTNNNALPGWFYSKNNPRYTTLTPTQQAAADRSLDSLRSIDTDWRDVFFRRGRFNSHDINLSGGAGKTRFFTSLGFYDEQGIGLRTNMRRYSFRTNVDHQTDRLTAAINAYAGYTFRNLGEAEGALNVGNPFLAAYFAQPYQHLRNPLTGAVDTGAGKFGANAYDRIVSATNKADQLKTNLNLSAEYLLVKNVSVGAFFGLDFRETQNERSIYPGTYFSNNQNFPLGPVNGPGTGLGGGQFGENTQRFFSYITRASAAYRNVFNGVHSVDVNGIVEFNREYTRNYNYIGYGINPALLNTPAGITPGDATNKLIAVVGGSRTSRSFFALLTTAKYSYDQRYTVNASFRRDGTSILPTENRFENFYSIGATWNVLKEKFAASWGKVNDLRFRVSYGQAANAENFPLGNFGYLATYAGTASYAAFGGEGTIVAPANAGNPDAQWERINTFNTGVDFGLFRNRLTGSLDLYSKITENNIVTQQLSATSGFGSQLINAAKVRNRGVELAINAEIVRSRDLVWSVGGNLAYNDNEVLDLGQVNEFELGTSIIRKGLPLGSHYLVKFAGVDASTGAPLYYDRTGKITTKYDPTTMAVAEFGTFNAPFIGGFNTNLRFHGFNISAFFTFQQDFYRANNQTYFITNPAFAATQNLSREVLTMWTKPGDVTNIQSPLYARQLPTSQDVEDASYVRFRNLIMSYDFSPRVVNALRGFSAIRVFTQAQNLYTWTKWTGFDPEDANNLATFEYPAPRIITFGLNFTFK